MTSLLALLLAGCADEVTVARAHHRNHSSPLAVPPPVLPKGSFDQARALVALTEGKQALQAGDLKAARQATESALDFWPVAIEGWEQLIDVCEKQQDAKCQRHAVFFHAKLVLLNGLPMRAAALGFETIAENQPGAKVDNMVYDQEMLAMATRLWAYCSEQDPAHARAGEPTETSFYDDYPYAPALLVIGIGAGLLSGINALANK